MRAMEGYWGSGLCQMPLDKYVGKWVLDSGCGGAGKKGDTSVGWALDMALGDMVKGYRFCRGEGSGLPHFYVLYIRKKEQT